MMIKCNVLSLMGSWNIERTLEKKKQKRGNLNEVLTSVNDNISVLAYCDKCFMMI